MTRIRQAFARGKAFIPFITAGDPNMEVTEQLVIKMAEASADLIELGIPFSDPVAEGEVISGPMSAPWPRVPPSTAYSPWSAGSARPATSPGLHDLCQPGVHLWGEPLPATVL